MNRSTVALFALVLLLVAVATSTVPRGCPHIDRVVPDVSLSTSARDLAIEGRDFEQGSLVYVGSRLLQGVEVQGGTRLTADLPRDLGAGTWPVRVVSPGNRDQDARSRLTILPSETAPVVTEVQPAEAQGAPLALRISGNNFRAGAAAFVGQVPLDVRAVDGSLIEACLREPLPPGTWDVRVQNPDGEVGVLSQGLLVRPATER